MTTKKIAKGNTKLSAQKDEMPILFTKENRKWMWIGGFVIVLGVLCMLGGGSSDSHIFDERTIYSTMRITVAPILILLGLVIEIYAILKTNKKANG